MESTETIPLMRVTPTGAQPDKGLVARELPLTIILNNQEQATLLCSPTNPEELAVGFLFSEGSINGKDELKSITVDDEKGIVKVATNRPKSPAKTASPPLITSGCGRVITAGYGGANNPPRQVVSQARLTPAQVLSLARQFQNRSETFRTTGGVHSAALCDEDNILVFGEDIGRHNAIDKVFGKCLLDDIATANRVVITSGRVSSEIVLKVARMNIPFLISRSAPTSLGVKLAGELGLTLVGFARGDKMNVYTEGWRIGKMANRQAELTQRIRRLKEERGAVILAHNYQLGEIQDIADFVGDSLELSLKAAAAEAKVIVFCGVYFMAETAAILAPQKTVLLPDTKATCPMAHMITAAELKEEKAKLPQASVVCYVNSTAEVKAESDVCCTSTNAVKVCESLDNDEILFVPDQYLGHYVSTKSNKKYTLWPGYCPTHAGIMPEDITRLRASHPGAKVIVHPECRAEVIELADEALSTGGMLKFARETAAEEIVVGTEVGIIHRLQKENPAKKFIAVSEKAVCPNMKRITLEKLLWSLEEMSPQIEVSPEISKRAKIAVDRMLEISRAD